MAAALRLDATAVLTNGDPLAACGPRAFSLGDRIVAAPISSLWA